MQIINLPIFWTIMIDILAWAVFHLVISYLMIQVPDSFFAKQGGWFQTQAWERNGQIWHRLFYVQNWKKHLPDGTMLLKSGHNKANLNATDLATINQFILETKRAEMTHWLSMLPAVLFFLWNPVWAGWVMVLYAVLFNLPFIVSQRYNRPRLEQISVYITKKNAKKRQAKPAAVEA